MKVKLIILLALLLILIFAWEKLINKKPVSPLLKKVSIGMGYIPNVQFAPFYVALDKGYFRNYGLDIDFNYGMETDIITLLAQNQLDFAIGSGEQVVLAHSAGLKIINVFNWYARFPVTITSLKESGITEPADLYGKKVGIPAMQGASFVGWQAFLKINRLDEKKIILEVIGYTQTASLSENRIDAAVTYKMNEPVQLALNGYQINNFEVADYANLVSNGILTNTENLSNHPQIINGFVKAFSAGLKDTINNPQEALEITKKYIPEIVSPEVPEAILAESIKFWGQAKLGQNLSSQWQSTTDILFDMGLIKAKPDINSLYSNDFLP